MPSVIQRETESFRIRSVAPVGVPSTRTRNVPEGRCVLREGFSTKTTRIPPTPPATQRRTRSLGTLLCALPPSPSMKRPIAPKRIRDDLRVQRDFHNEQDGAVHPVITARMLGDAEAHPGSVQT